MRTVKSLPKDCKDPHLALLSYRTTPFPFCNYSPAQLLMGRYLRSAIPILPEALFPNWPDLKQFREIDDKYKRKLKKWFNRRHCVRELPVLDDQVPVYISSGRNTSASRGTNIPGPNTNWNI